MKAYSENQQARGTVGSRLKRFVVLVPLLWLVATQAQLYTVDDGSVETFGGTSSGDLLALNHFSTGPSPVVIDEIRVLWNPISSTVAPTVALYSDPNGDGNPSDMTPLVIQPISIPPSVVVLNNTTVQGYSIPATLVSGSFFVGAYLSDGESSFNPVIGVDLAHLAPHQSWIIENSRAGALSLQNPIGTSTSRSYLDTYVAGNHMIEAHFTPVPEPPCIVLFAVGLSCVLLKTRRPTIPLQARPD